MSFQKTFTAVSVGTDICTIGAAMEVLTVKVSYTLFPVLTIFAICVMVISVGQQTDVGIYTTLFIVESLDQTTIAGGRS